jgi:hypothetical protein
MGDYRNKGHLKKLLGSRPDEDGFCSLETKYDRRIAPRLPNL